MNRYLSILFSSFLLYSCSMEQNSSVNYITFQQESVDVQKDSLGLVISTLVKDSQYVFSVEEEIESILAFYRYGPWKAWTKPISVSSISELPENDIQILLIKNNKGEFLCFYPVVDNAVTTIGNKDGQLTIITQNNHSSSKLLTVSKDKDPYIAIKKAIKLSYNQLNKTDNLIENKIYPQQFTKLGWCTWNSFYDQLNEEKLIKGLQTFKNNDVQIGNMVVDDGWLGISEDRKLEQFGPNSLKFPNGFKPFIDKIKEEKLAYNVGVWHTLNGFWKGIKSGSELDIKYQDKTYTYKDQETWLLDSLPKEDIIMLRPDYIGEFFDNWHSFLKDEGVNFVKVDNQLVIERMQNEDFSIAHLAKSFENGLQQSVSKHFNGAVINCMDMANYNFQNFGSSAVARVEEDYFPEGEGYNLEHGNAAAHITNAFYNTIWMGEMVWPDFDMFESHHPNAEYHAIARAISGGPVYITDGVGKSNYALIKSLINENGDVFKFSNPPKLHLNNLQGVMDNQLLKTYNIENNIISLAVFQNNDAENTKDNVTGNSFGLEDMAYITYDVKMDTVFEFSGGQVLELDLPRLDWRYFHFYPKSEIVVLGNLEKLNPQLTFTPILRNNQLEFEAKTSGNITIYSTIDLTKSNTDIVRKSNNIYTIPTIIGQKYVINH